MGRDSDANGHLLKAGPARNTPPRAGPSQLVLPPTLPSAPRASPPTAWPSRPSQPSLPPTLLSAPRTSPSLARPPCPARPSSQPILPSAPHAASLSAAAPAAPPA